MTLRRDLDLLRVIELQRELGTLDRGMVALCLFDVYRGVFAHPEMRVKSSGVTTEVQASAKLTLMAYLL